MGTDIDLMRAESVVAAIGFGLTKAFPATTTRVTTPENGSPATRGCVIRSRNEDRDLAGEADHADYWVEITKVLESAREILVLGHGKGKVNASHLWVSYVEKHRKDVAAKLVAEVRVDIDELTDAQVVGLARDFFASPAHARFRKPRTIIDPDGTG